LVPCSSRWLHSHVSLSARALSVRHSPLAQEFDELVAIVPPAISLASDSSPSNINTAASITELPDPSAETVKYDKRRKADKVWRVVLFHADWIRKSRELEMTLAQMSNE
jgi:hypothetical protein